MSTTTATVPATIPVAVLRDMLAACSKTDTRPILTHPWIAGDDLVASDSYVLAIHPGVGKDIPDGSIPRGAIELADRIRARDVTVTEDAVLIRTDEGEIAWPRPKFETDYPDHNALIAKHDFSDDRPYGLNPNLLTNLGQAIGLGNHTPVRLTRVHGDTSGVTPSLVTHPSGTRDQPYGMIMPVRLRG